jgi:hypothetical protein
MILELDRSPEVDRLGLNAPPLRIGPGELTVLCAHCGRAVTPRRSRRALVYECRFCGAVFALPTRMRSNTDARKT